MECEICENNDNNKIYNVKEMMFGLEDAFDYSECSKCGCLQIAQIPNEMSKYYPENYYSFEDSSINLFYELKNQLRKIRYDYAITEKGSLGSILNKLYPAYDIYSLMRAEINRDSRILDVGCGKGYMLSSLRDAGFKKLLGIDPFIKKDFEHENGVLILKRHLQDLDHQFDLIMFNHSFEHMSNPFETLLRVSELLSKGGICLIRIPTVTSYAWKKYKADWVSLDAPRHFFLYSLYGIKLIASKAGLALKDYYYDSTDFQFSGSELYKCGIPLYPRTTCGKIKKMYIFNVYSRIKDFNKMAENLNKDKMGDQVSLFFSKM